MSDFDNRPKIPADMRRRVLVEAGHRCAIPTCRYIEVDIHHIVPWSQCKSHQYDNLIALCPNCHRRADSGEIDRKSLRLYKINLRFAHDKFSNLEIDILAALAKLDFTQAMQWPAFNVMLLNRILEAGYIRLERPGGAATVLGMSITPLKMTITNEGKSFIDEMGMHEMH